MIKSKRREIVNREPRCLIGIIPTNDICRANQGIPRYGYYTLSRITVYVRENAQFSDGRSNESSLFLQFAHGTFPGGLVVFQKSTG